MSIYIVSFPRVCARLSVSQNMLDPEKRAKTPHVARRQSQSVGGIFVRKKTRNKENNRTTRYWSMGLCSGIELNLLLVISNEL